MENPTRNATRLAKGAALIGAGALGATILTGVAFADSDTSTGAGSSISGMPAHAEGRGGHGGPGGPGGPERGFGQMRGGEMLHSEGVVETPEGTIQTVASVRGDVTAVNDSSITVRASDGYERTFAVNAETEVSKSREDADISAIAVGDKAMVTGVVNGDTTTAERVHAMTAEEAAEREAEMEQRRAEMQERLQERLDEMNSTTSS